MFTLYSVITLKLLKEIMLSALLSLFLLLLLVLHARHGLGSFFLTLVERTRVTQPTDFVRTLLDLALHQENAKCYKEAHRSFPHF
mgnify:CR=1 FL=1